MTRRNRLPSTMRTPKALRPLPNTGWVRMRDGTGVPMDPARPGRRANSKALRRMGFLDYLVYERRTSNGPPGNRTWYRVISTTGLVAPEPGGKPRHVTWHVSMSLVERHGERFPLDRPTDDEMKALALAFRLPEPWEEDNHHPGRARHLLCPVDPELRTECECKSDEALVIEPDGYVWTNPIGAEENPLLCRGCEAARWFGYPCTVHGGGRRVW